jgi:hypothetical protein
MKNRNILCHCLCYCQTNLIAKVGDVAIFGKYGHCRILQISSGEAEGENLFTKEKFWGIVSELDFVS